MTLEKAFKKVGKRLTSDMLQKLAKVQEDKNRFFSLAGNFGVSATDRKSVWKLIS